MQVKITPRRIRLLTARNNWIKGVGTCSYLALVASRKLLRMHAWIISKFLSKPVSASFSPFIPRFLFSCQVPYFKTSNSLTTRTVILPRFLKSLQESRYSLIDLGYRLSARYPFFSFMAFAHKNLDFGIFNVHFRASPQILNRGGKVLIMKVQPPTYIYHDADDGRRGGITESGALEGPSSFLRQCMYQSCFFEYFETPALALFIYRLLL